MTTIKLKVIDENIEFTSSPPVYSGDVNTIETQFEFGENWEGFTKSAVFYREIDKPYMQVLKDDACLIPHEVMRTQGRIYVGVFGVLDEQMSQGQEEFKTHMEQVFQEYHEELKTISANFMIVEDVDRIVGGEYDPSYDDYNAESITQDELLKILV